MRTSMCMSRNSAPITFNTVTRPNTQEFSLILDGRTHVPVLFTDASGGQLLREYTPSASLSNPGKFYSGDAALSLLNALRSSGIAGRVVVRSDASVDLKTHFQRFSQRLQDGELVRPKPCHVDWPPLLIYLPLAHRDFGLRPIRLLLL